jgi:HD superfamily phosphohydrolase
MEKILGRFTIDNVIALRTEPHIKDLLNKIKAAPGTQIEYTDPIHKKRELPDWLIKAINTPPVLRLAEVGQMPLTGHSRLAHSIGVAIMALDLAEKFRLSPQETKNLCITALLHDIGHGPYSHLYEKLYIRDKTERFDHDQHRTKLIHSTVLSDTLRNLDIDPSRISEALSNPKEHWMAYLAKEILDRLDYNMRDSEYSAFKPESKKWIHKRTRKALNYIEITPDSVHFSPEGKRAIDKFMLARCYTFNSLAYDPKVRIVESLISKAIRAELAKLDDNIRHKAVEALSYLSDAQLNSLLPAREKAALKEIFDNGDLPLVMLLKTDDISGSFRQKDAIKPKNALEVLTQSRLFSPDTTILVAFAPLVSPAMTFKIKTKSGEIKSIRRDRGTGDSSSSEPQQPQIGTLSIAAYDSDGKFIEPTDEMKNKILRAFANKGWLNGREDERVFTGWPGNWDTRNSFGATEMPSGAEKEFEALAKNPSKATPQ